MSLFPAYVVEDIEETNDEIETPKEYGIDFNTGQLTGIIVEGIEAVKVWCYLALQVARYRYFICSWEYGSELEDLYGKGYSAEHIEVEAARMIEECLLTNDYISAVSVTNASYINGRFKAEISVTTIYGEETSDTYETEVAA